MLFIFMILLWGNNYYGFLYLCQWLIKTILSATLFVCFLNSPESYRIIIIPIFCTLCPFESWSVMVFHNVLISMFSTIHSNLCPLFLHFDTLSCAQTCKVCFPLLHLILMCPETDKLSKSSSFTICPPKIVAVVSDG